MGNQRKEITVLSSRWHLLKIGLALFLFVLGIVLHPVALSPDQRYGWGDIIGCFCVFVSWVLGLLAWGRVLSRICGISALGYAPVLAFGTLWASLFAGGCGYLGLIGASSLPLFLL